MAGFRARARSPFGCEHGRILAAGLARFRARARPSSHVWHGAKAAGCGRDASLGPSPLARGGSAMRRAAVVVTGRGKGGARVWVVAPRRWPPPPSGRVVEWTTSGARFVGDGRSLRRHLMLDSSVPCGSSVGLRGARLAGHRGARLVDEWALAGVPMRPLRRLSGARFVGRRAASGSTPARALPASASACVANGHDATQRRAKGGRSASGSGRPRRGPEQARTGRPDGRQRRARRRNVSVCGRPARVPGRGRRAAGRARGRPHRRRAGGRRPVASVGRKVAEAGRTSGRQPRAFRPRETRLRAARASRCLPRPRPLEARRGTPAHANSAQDVKGFYYTVS